MKLLIILFLLFASCKNVFYHSAYYGLYVSDDVYELSPVTKEIIRKDFDFLIIGDGYISMGSSRIRVAYIPGPDKIYLVGNGFQIILDQIDVRNRRDIIFQRMTFQGNPELPPVYTTWKILRKAKRIQDGTIY